MYKLFIEAPQEKQPKENFTSDITNRTLQPRKSVAKVLLSCASFGSFWMSATKIFSNNMGVSLNGGIPKTPQNDHF